MSSSAGKKLHPKHKLFTEEYLLDLKPGLAYRRAGYQPTNDRSANVAASKLLKRPDIQAYLGELMETRSSQTGITAIEVIQELRHIAMARQGTYVSWRDGVVTFVNSHNLTPEEMAAVASVSFETRNFGEDTTTTMQFKLHDKVKALGMLMRHLGIDSPQEDEPTKLNNALTLVRKYGYRTIDSFSPEVAIDEESMLGGA